MLIKRYNPEVCGLKVLLVNPIWSFQNYPPLNLVELASFLIHNGFKNTKIIDLNFEIKNKFRDNLIAGSVKKILKKKPDIICITCNAVQFPFVCELSKELKLQAKSPVVVGGVTASLDAKLVLKLTKADFVIRGEGELTLFELLQFFQKKRDLKNINGLSYADEVGKIIHNKDRKLLNLDDLPFPHFNLISKNLKNNKNIWLTASRGCAYQCKFCSGNDIWHFQRRKKPSVIEKQLKTLKTKYGVKNFIFGDDCLTLNKNWLKELCFKIEALKLKWGCLSRIDLIDEDILKYIKKAGCSHIYHGIESGSNQVRKKLDKKMSYPNISILNTVKAEIKQGFSVTCSFMTGIPFESQSDMTKTFELARQIKNTGAKVQLWLLTPYRGLKILKEYKKQLFQINRWQSGLQSDVFDTGQFFLYSGFINKYAKYNPDNFIFLPKNMTMDKFIKKFNDMSMRLGLKNHKKQLTAKEIFILKNIKHYLQI